MRKALQRTLDRIYEPISSSSSSKSRSSKSTSSSTSRATVSGLDPSTRPSLTTLDLLIQHSNGDIRSALMSLQFLATQGGGEATSLGVSGKGGGGKAKKPKKRKRGSSEEDSEEEVRGAMGGKDKAKQLCVLALLLSLLEVRRTC
jgi:cell cycle checkpoint protein